MEITEKDREKLSHVFDNTTATYKFYWMLSLLDIVEQGRAHSTITFEEMVARMVSKAWQPAKIGLFDFGKCDTLCRRIDNLIVSSPLNIMSMEDRVRCFITSNRDMKSIKMLVKEMTKYVPYRFLYPWIGVCNNSEAQQLSQQDTRRTLYYIKDKTLVINPIWRKYLIENSIYLHGWAFERLCIFLNQRNPGYILPASSDCRLTADGTTLLHYSLPISDCTAFAAEHLRHTTKLHANKLVITGDMQNINSSVNIKFNIENTDKPEKK